MGKQQELSAKAETVHEVTKEIVKQFVQLFVSIPGFVTEEIDVNNMKITHKKATDFAITVTIISTTYESIRIRYENGATIINRGIIVASRAGNGYAGRMKVGLFYAGDSFILELYDIGGIRNTTIGIIKANINGAEEFITVEGKCIRDKQFFLYYVYTESLIIYDKLLKTDNPFIYKPNEGIVGYLEDVVGFVIDTVGDKTCRIETDGHVYACMPVNATNLIGIKET